MYRLLPGQRICARVWEAVARADDASSAMLAGEVSRRLNCIRLTLENGAGYTTAVHHGGSERDVH